MSSRSRPVAPVSVAIRVIVLVLACCPAGAGELPPTPKAYFNDYAGVISEPKRRELNERLARFDKATTNQVVVAIFPEMDSTPSLDEYTLRIAKAWGVGQRGKNNGAILFVFVRDLTMRMQVGDGLTGVLTNARSKQILDEELKPAFEKREFDGGLSQGVAAILETIGGEVSSAAAEPE